MLIVDVAIVVEADADEEFDLERLGPHVEERPMLAGLQTVAGVQACVVGAYFAGDQFALEGAFVGAADLAGALGGGGNRVPLPALMGSCCQPGGRRSRRRQISNEILDIFS